MSSAPCHEYGKLTTALVRAVLRAGGGLADLAALMPTEQSVNLLSIPLFHATGCLSILLSSVIKNGGKLVFQRRWSVPDAIKLIKEEKVTSIGGYVRSAGLGRAQLRSVLQTALTSTVSPPSRRRSCSRPCCRRTTSSVRSGTAERRLRSGSRAICASVSRPPSCRTAGA